VGCTHGYLYCTPSGLTYQSKLEYQITLILCLLLILYNEIKKKYINASHKLKKFYIGQTVDPDHRLQEKIQLNQDFK
jgi:hypothetical protein